MKSIYYLRIECDTLSEVEGYIKRNGIFPDIVVINGNVFERSQEYKNTSNEVYECYKHYFNDDKRDKIAYTFSCSYGLYENPEERYKINTYNFLKDEVLEEPLF